ncbi:MAG TPA: hypothetical protein VN176_07965 [Verrucomicrobiae bacterium]|jgi:hypothetical protein|nr:hypothetical protein [Verrucomicrobiae bacterium]
MIILRNLMLLVTSCLAPLMVGGQSATPAHTRAPQSTVSTDCTRETAKVPRGFTRVYIGQRNGQDGPGASWSDARDGSTAESFDKVLRCFSEGCQDSDNRGKSVPKTEKLIVCIGPGVFQSNGTYDYIINVPHTSHKGFTLGREWKIHGSGVAQTTVQLIAYRRSVEPKDPEILPARTGHGLVFSTNSDGASGIEISDLTVDANYPYLKTLAQKEGVQALNLEAIHLRADEGGHWIHNVNVIHASGEIGTISGMFETFPVWIASVRAKSTPADNSGNIIENVTMSQFHGGLCTAIAVANATAEVRNNAVNGYQIGYGGWSMGAAWFHDNIASGTDYGFNIDSLNNDGVRIESNQIIAPRKYGFVIGGGGTYRNFILSHNTIQIKDGGVIGILFRGNVTKSVIAENTLLADRASTGNAIAIKNASAGHQTGPNLDNTYQSNRIDSSLKAVFYAPSRQSQNCFFGNVDEQGRPRSDLKDNHSGPCVAMSH